jgi:hypothetical protein
MLPPASRQTSCRHRGLESRASSARGSPRWQLLRQPGFANAHARSTHMASLSEPGASAGNCAFCTDSSHRPCLRAITAWRHSVASRHRRRRIYRTASMSGAMSPMRKYRLYRRTNLPSGATRNFSAMVASRPSQRTSREPRVHVVIEFNACLFWTCAPKFHATSPRAMGDQSTDESVCVIASQSSTPLPLLSPG